MKAKVKKALNQQVADRLNQIGLPCLDGDVFGMLMSSFLKGKAMLVIVKSLCPDCGKYELRIRFAPRTNKSLRVLFK